MSAQFSTQIAQLKSGASFRKVLIDLAALGEVGLGIVKTAALDFAERALPHYEAEHPGDLRLRDAIEVARRYLRGEATIEELISAKGAAAAAEAVAWAIWATTYAHGWAAAQAAAWAAWAADHADAERVWQREHLIKLLEAAE